MKIGGGSPEMGPTAGIHWHMNIMQEIEYVANDYARQQIVYVKTSDNQNKVTEYFSAENPLTHNEIDKRPKFKVDCIDCHNRPSHVFKPPTSAVDLAMYLKYIDPTLPYIKKVAVEALSFNYSTNQMALDSIHYVIEIYYGNEYKDIAATRTETIKKAVLEVQKIYSRNFYPSMQVAWKAYPENISHLNSPGCFRCHNRKLVSPLGKAITRDCNSCHTILYQGSELVPKTLTTTGLEFQHPEDIGDEWKTTNCNECHIGE